MDLAGSVEVTVDAEARVAAKMQESPTEVFWLAQDELPCTGAEWGVQGMGTLGNGEAKKQPEQSGA